MNNEQELAILDAYNFLKEVYGGDVGVWGDTADACMTKLEKAFPDLIQP